MRFIAGPRQSGKTTLAKMKLKSEGDSRLYYLWDLREVRERYKTQELFFTSDRPPEKGRKHWVCFDEIHKLPRWKNILKGIFDGSEADYQLIVTGSSKLDIFRGAGDSLSGRYLNFHLFPVSFKEVTGRSLLDLKEYATARDFVLTRLNDRGTQQDRLDHLLRFSGFPEPLVAASDRFQRKWSQAYLDRVITEDIGMLTRIVDREKLHDLYHLLPEMIGSPLSENSLASHLESSPVTIKNYLKRLADFYLVFRVAPYSRNIKRGLLKAAKWYLYDWTRIENPAFRFENYLAVELSSRLHALSDLSGERFDLRYVRDKEKNETDFLLLRGGKPWLLVEAKISDGSIASHHFSHARALGDVPIVQVCYEPGVASQHAKHAYRISANRFLA
ncbi:MAG: AAA family ATPase [Candidatus Omnitrophota bacterium]